MKNLSRILMMFLFSAVIVFQSCTVEKRRYTSGFHVDLHKSKPVKHEDLKADSDVKKTALNKVEIPDSTVAPNTMESFAENHIVPADSSFPNRNEAKIVTQDPVAIEKKKVQGINFLKPLSHTHFTGELKTEKVDEGGSGGADSVMSWIAFAFAVLSIALVVLAMVVNGWAGLGYIAMALIAGVFTVILSIIAKILTDKRQNPTPWNLWFALAVGALWAIITLRVLFDRV